jgi:CMP-N,N'-diacetyllegionaminic acid synthase
VTSLGVIVARGGSKRVHRKVLRQLGGHPLIAWMVRAALNSRLDRVILSTDDDEIAGVAESYGADVPFRRSEELVRDDTRNDAVLLDALDRMETIDGRQYNEVVLLQSTAPYTQPDQIDACIKSLVKGDVNCVFTTRAVREPPSWMFRECQDGTLERLLGGELIGAQQLTQSHDKVYLPAGSVWAVRADALRKHNAVYLPPLKMIQVPHECAVDLDEEFDFLIADAVAKQFCFKLLSLPGMNEKA